MRKLLGVMLSVFFATSATAQPVVSLLPTVQQIRAEYPTPMSPAQVGELLNRVAWQHRAEGWGLLKKTGGNRCPAPQGVEISCDILIHAPTVRHFDVLSDVEHGATPVWNDVGPCVPGPASGCSMDRFVAPTGTPPGGGTDIEELRKHVEALAINLQAQREAIIALSEGLKLLAETVQKVDTSHREDINALKARPVPTGCRANFIGLPVGCSLTQ